MNTNTFSENIDGSNYKIAIIRSRFNESVTQGLLNGCHKALSESQVKDEHIDIIEVPGAFEISVAAMHAAKKKYDAIVTLGAVVRGDTPHFDYICKSVTDGTTHVSIMTGIPVAFGVLTVDNLKQAEGRSGDNEHNKGYEAGRTAVEMIEVLSRILI